MNYSLSIVAPVFNGTLTVREFTASLVNYLNAELVDLKYEVVLVDDGSSDDSWDIIEQLSEEYTFLSGVKLSRNFGQQLAVSAGVEEANGDQIIIMDADMQNPVEAIPLILMKLKEGYDIVYTTSKVRNSISSRISSSFFWLILTKLLKVQVVPNQLMMRGMSARMRGLFNDYSEKVRTVAGINLDIGLNSTSIEVINKRRVAGRSNYNFFKRFNLMLDIVISLTNSPLNFIINISLVSLFITSLSSAYYIYNFLFLDVVPGFTSLILVTFFFGSLITLILGIIGRYLSNIYTEVRGRPKYIVNKITKSHE